jgi:sugar O-acyltransferase (sialic acid O-acetyltransferase NeuD family)
MKSEIILIGGGGHCKACIDVIETEGKYKIKGILDLPKLVGSKILDYEIIGTDHDLPRFVKEVKHFLITVGQIKSAEKRIDLFKMVKNAGGTLPAIISQTAYVAKSARIGEGSIVMHQAMVNTNARVGANCIINSKALIEHDAVVGDHCHISTASVINGNVGVGEGTFFGSGAISVQSANIPAHSFVRARSLYYRK